MRNLLLVCLILGSLSASADEVLDLVSYYMSVSARKSEIVYTHDIYDRNHVVRASLVKTVYPGKFGPAHTEYSVYDLQFKDSAGNVTQSISLDKSTYTKFRSKIERAKLETAYASWTSGCALRALVDNKRGYYGLLSMCDENPVEDSIGTLEADSDLR